MRLHSPSVRSLTAVGAVLAASVPASAASADALFHTARYELRAIGGAPLYTTRCQVASLD